MASGDKTALITGAAARVGATITRALHAAGFHVVVHYRSSARAAKTLRDELLAQRADSVTLVQGDLLETATLGALVEAAIAATGRLDVLVNNASSYYPTPVGDITEQHWDDLFGSNAKAPLFLSQAAAPALRKSGGCIVNLVDIHAERPHAEHTTYCMAKAANAMLVKSLARELAPRVRVNGVAPGAVLWPDDYMADRTKQAILKRIPLGRPGEPEDIARAVLFLIESDYVTGQVINVDGGRTTQQ